MAGEQTVQIDDVVLEPGKLIQERYELGEALGAGGFAKVFEAFDSNIERPVAIKFLDLHQSLSNPEAAAAVLARFEREAKLAARIEHPNVVNIYDYGLLGAQSSVPFIVMERLNGRDLDEEIDRHGPMPPARALPLFIGCLEALGKAHQEGIVHKDIKPSNLFLSNPEQRDESLRLVDFGIAHIKSAAEARLTQTGEVLGTPQYFAPEYLSDQRVGPALDVYQMGLVLVELLSGRPVVDLENPLLCMHTHSQGELEVPAALLDSPLGPVIVRALKLDDAQRFADGYTFADALREVDPASVPDVDFHDQKRLIQGFSQDSRELVGARHTDAAERPTRPATPAAQASPQPTADAAPAGPTLAATAPLDSSEPKHSSAGVYVILGLLVLLVLGAGTSVVALLAGDANEGAEQASEPTSTTSAPTEGTEKTEPTAPSAAATPSPTDSAPPKNDDIKDDKPEAKKQPESDKRERDRRRERAKRERKKQSKLEKRRERLERKLEREGRKKIEKTLERLGDF